MKNTDLTDAGEICQGEKKLREDLPHVCFLNFSNISEDGAYYQDFLLIFNVCMPQRKSHRLKLLSQHEEHFCHLIF